jgi:hypothetical protein
MGLNRPPCGKVKNKIHCLLQKHEDLSKNPNWLEQTYLEAEKQAIKCSNPKDTGEFLEFGLHIGGRAAIEEYFSGVIEKELLAKNSKCFLSALDKTSPKVRDKICSMLSNPLLLEEKQVDELYAKYSKQAKLSKWVANCLKPSVEPESLPGLIAAAKEDKTKPGGEDYDQEATTSIGNKLAFSMRKCSPKGTKKGKFDNVFVIDSSGHVLATKYTEDFLASKCLDIELTGVSFPKPPFAPFHLHLEMTITD